MRLNRRLFLRGLGGAAVVDHQLAASFLPWYESPMAETAAKIRDPRRRHCFRPWNRAAPNRSSTSSIPTP